MEDFQETFTVRTREGREFTGLTLSSLRIAADQKIFSLEDSVRSEKVAGAWTPLAKVLGLLEPQSPLPIPAETAPGPRSSTGISLDLEAYSSRPQPVVPSASREIRSSRSEAPCPSWDEEEGPARHRLRISGGFLLLWGILGMVGYAFGKHGPADSITMLVNTGLGITLLMNRPEIRRWAVGWVVAGWALFCGAGLLAGGCLGFVVIGLLSGLAYGGPACLLWGEECPRPRFWTGVTLMGALVLLMGLIMVLVAVAGATLLQRMRF